MMEFVEDDDVEVIGREVSQACGIEALDGREHVVEMFGSRAADPFLPKGSAAQRVTECREALVEYFVAVGNEKESGSG